MIEFDQCCFCIPLRTGCLILGYLHLIVATIFATVSIVGLIAISAVVPTNDMEFDTSSLNLIIGVTVVLLLLVVILLPISILLVVGLHKEIRVYVKVFLIYFLVFIIIYFVIFVVRCAKLSFDLWHTLGTSYEIIFGVYFFLVIRSHWVVMGQNHFNTT